MANVSPDSQLEFNLGEGETETDVELMDAPQEKSSAQEQEYASEPEAQAAPAPEPKSELDQVSENVQKRIAKLTAKMREAERREQAAIEYARNVQSQAQELQQKLVVTDQSRLSEAKTRLETQQATLRSIIKRAREEGDIDTETEAQQRLAELSYEQRQVSDWIEQQKAQPVQRQEPVYQPQPQQYQQQPARPSVKADAWAEKNPWFGQDRTMTYAAWGIHQTLVDEEGIDPESDEYYTELDNRLRNEFPNKFQQSAPVNRQRSTVPSVAPASRSSGVNSARRSVRLSPSQVAIAKKLGVPLEEYAKYVKE
jgi:hypothetical protein